MRHVWLQMCVWQQFQGHEFDPSPVPYFRGGILKKSADENKSMKNYPACNELPPFKPNCYELTPFQPNCFVLNAFNVCCIYSSVIQTSQNLSCSWKQSLWTRIRLILREQSYLGLLQYLIPKNIFRQNGRSKSVWLVDKGVNLCISHAQQIHWKVLSWAL